MTKKELRKIYKKKRLAIDSKAKLKLDDLLLIQFQNLSFENIRMLLSYWPMANVAEPNTHLFSGYLRHTIQSLQIAYPVTDFLLGTMDAVLINEDSIYKTNDYDITEPVKGEIINPEIIDIVFVPFLICDKQGYRVGFGKGFYDKFLPQCRKDIIKTGFSYFEPVDKIEDAQSFDVPLNYCITPHSIYEF